MDEDKNTEQTENLEVDSNESITKELDLKAELASCIDLLKRTQADFINYKTRVSKEIIDVVFLQTKEIALELIDFKELILLSIKNEKNEETKKVLNVLLEKINNSLLRLNIVKIELVDCTPDYNVCECISVIPTKNVTENNKIIEIIEDGYLFNNKIIKPAKIIVGKLEE